LYQCIQTINLEKSSNKSNEANYFRRATNTAYILDKEGRNIKGVYVTQNIRYYLLYEIVFNLIIKKLTTIAFKNFLIPNT
jgi:hypothetical protein